MFFIVNKTKKVVHLSDIKITLGPRQAIDLDQFINRDISEGSESLKEARVKGEIEIRIKDKIKEKHSVNLQSQKNSDISDLKKMISDLKGAVDGISSVSPSTEKSGISKEDLDKITKAIVSQIPQNKETIIIQNQETKKVEEVDINMTDEMLAIINARTVDKIVKDTEVKSVHYNEKEDKNSILNNVNELEDLLG